VRRSNDTIRNGVIVVTLIVLVFGVYTYINTSSGDSVRVVSSNNAASVNTDVFDKLTKDSNLDTQVDLTSLDF